MAFIALCHFRTVPWICDCSISWSDLCGLANVATTLQRQWTQNAILHPCVGHAQQKNTFSKAHTCNTTKSFSSLPTTNKMTAKMSSADLLKSPAVCKFSRQGIMSTERQTVWTNIRKIKDEQSDLRPHCLLTRRKWTTRRYNKHYLELTYNKGKVTKQIYLKKYEKIAAFIPPLPALARNISWCARSTLM